MEIKDLEQEAALGILHALRKWTPGGGASFRTYAGLWINAYVRKAVKMQLPVVRPTQSSRDMQPQAWLDAPIRGGTRTMADDLRCGAASPERVVAAREELRRVPGSLLRRAA